MLPPLKPRPRGARTKKKKGSSKSARPTTTHGYFRGVDGTRLFYSTEGEGLPLIFCYGLVCSSLHWTYQIDYFRQKYKTVWFDYRGHQNSETPKDLNSLTVSNMAGDLACLMDELKIDKAVLLGHSMGVNVVLEHYHLHPDRFAGMVLANGTAKRPLETLFGMNALQGVFKILGTAYRKSPKLVSSLWGLQKDNLISRMIVTHGGFNPHLTPREDIELYINQVAEMDPGILIHLIENYDQYDASSWLHTVQSPTLIIAGEQDHMIPVREQELMHQLIPGSKLEIVRHGSHCPQMDLPELVNLKIEKFLESVAAW